MIDKIETPEELESKFCETLTYIFGYHQDELGLNIPLDRARAIIGAHESTVRKAAYRKGFSDAIKNMQDVGEYNGHQYPSNNSERINEILGLHKAKQEEATE